MKKIQLSLFAVAIIAILSAFATNTNRAATKKWRVIQEVLNGSSQVIGYQVEEDEITTLVKGESEDYICEQEDNTCTVLTEDTEPTDQGGGVFYLAIEDTFSPDPGEFQLNP
jgi:hypothetical protein